MTIKRKSSSGLPTALALQHSKISSRVLWNYQKHQLIIRLPHTILDNSVMNRATTYPLYWPSWQFYAEGSTQLPRRSIPLVNRLWQTQAENLALVGASSQGEGKAFFLVGECLWSGWGWGGGHWQITPGRLYSLCPLSRPGSLWLKISRGCELLSCIAITETREFFQELLNKRETFLGSTEGIIARYGLTLTWGSSLQIWNNADGRCLARWRSGDLVIHHITLLSLSLSVCLTLSGWGGGQVSRPFFVIDGRLGIEKIAAGWILQITQLTGRARKEQLQFSGRGQWARAVIIKLLQREGTCLAMTRGTSYCQSGERKLVISIWPSDFAWLLSAGQAEWPVCKITRRPSVSSHWHREIRGEEWTLHYDWDDWAWHGEDQSRGNIFIVWSDF